MDKLRAIEYFVQSVRAGSMSAAARQLDVSPPAVAKLINALEKDLGVTLLRRESRRLLLTPDGDRYLKTCHRLLADLRATEAALSAGRGTASGRLVVGVSRTALHHCLVPRLADFCARHPQLELEFRSVDYADQPLAGLCDVLVLIGWQADGDWVAQQVARGRHSVVATPAFWASHDAPKEPGDLERYPAMCYRVPRGVVLDRWRFGRGDEVRVIEPRFRLLFDDRDAMLQAALAGQGIFFSNDVTMLPWLRDGRLTVALPEWTGLDSPPVHLMYRRGAKSSAAVRAFGDFVTTTFGDLMKEREAYGPVDTGSMPDWFKARYVGRLSERRAEQPARASAR